MVTIEDSQVRDNVANKVRLHSINKHRAQFGGAFYVKTSAVATLRRTSLVGNIGDQGGVASVETATIDIEACTVMSNNAVHGGGVFVQSSFIRVTGSVFEGNTAHEGGALSMRGSDARAVITGSRLASHSARFGGVFAIETSVAGITLKESVVEGNSASFGGVVTAGVPGVDKATRAPVIDGDNVVLRRNSAIKGSVAYVELEAALALTGFQVTNNSATEGTVYVDVLAVAELHRIRSSYNSVVYAGALAAFTPSASGLLNATTSVGDVVTSGPGVVHAGTSGDVSLDSVVIENAISSMGGVIYASSAARLGVKSSAVRSSSGSPALYVDSTGEVDVDDFEVQGMTTAAVVLRDKRTTAHLRRVTATLNLGGALHVLDGARVALSHSLLQANKGGAFVSSGSSLSCDGVAFVENSNDSGGAVQARESSHVLLSNSILRNNEAVAGGALSVEDSVAELEACRFEGNAATDGGAFSVGCRGELVVSPTSSFVANVASAAGGVAFFKHRCATAPSFNNATTDDNRAGYGPILASDIASIDASYDGRPASSGKLVPSPIVAIARDSLGQKCATLATTAWLTLPKGSNASLNGDTESVAFEMRDGVAATATLGLSVRGAPGSSVVIDVSALDVKSSVTLPLRECRVGEARLFDECRVCNGDDEINFFPLRRDMSATTCSTCPEHASCSDGANNTGHSLRPRHGYWRSTRLSLNVRRCLHAEWCAGGVDLWVDASSCKGHHAGPLCAKCEPHFTLTKKGECIDCRPGNKRQRLVPGLAGAAALFFVVLVAIFRRLYVGQHRRNISMGTPQLTSSERRQLLTLWAMIKLVVVYVQIVASAQYTLDYVHFSSGYRRLLETASLLGLDLDSPLALVCVETDHLDKLRTSTLFPLSLGAAIFAWWAARPRSAETTRKAVSAALFLSCLIITTSSTVIFRTFYCDDDFVDGEPNDSPYLGRAFLEADYRVDCHSKRYKLLRIYAFEMAAVYPVGIPLVYLILLFGQQADINPQDPKALALAAQRDNQADARLGRLATLYLELDTKMASMPPGARTLAAKAQRKFAHDLVHEHRMNNANCAHLAFLFRDYVPHRWYTEIVESARRLILTCLLPSIYPRKNVGRVYVAMMFVLAFALGYEYLRPFADRDVAAFAAATHALLTITLFVTILLYSEHAMTEEDRAHFNTAYLDAALVVVSAVVTPLVTVAFLVLKLRKFRRENAATRPPSSSKRQLSSRLPLPRLHSLILQAAADDEEQNGDDSDDGAPDVSNLDDLRAAFCASSTSGSQLAAVPPSSWPKKKRFGLLVHHGRTNHKAALELETSNTALATASICAFVHRGGATTPPKKHPPAEAARERKEDADLV